MISLLYRRHVEMEQLKEGVVQMEVDDGRSGSSSNYRRIREWRQVRQ